MLRLVARLVAILAVLPALAAPAAQAQALRYVDRLAVYDATGRQVGTAWPKWGYLDGDGAPYVAVEFRLGPIPVRVHLTEDAIYSTRFLRFSNRGCTGDVMLNEYDYSHAGHPYTAIVGPRKTVYVQSGSIRVRTTRSALIANGACVNYGVGLRNRKALLRATNIHLVDHFVPPFTTGGRAVERVPE